MAKEQEQPSGTRYVLCVADDREYNQLRKLAREQHPHAECIQAIPTGYLTRDAELVYGFVVGDGNIRDEHKRQIERQPLLTPPVKAADHWTPGGKGRFGAIRLADFLQASAAVIQETANAEGHPANTNIRHYNDELTLTYG